MPKPNVTKNSKILPSPARAPSVGVSIASGMTMKNVSYQIDGHQILTDVSVHVEPGKVLCLLGPSGSGKTSLLRIAAGLIDTAQGEVFIDDRLVAGPGVFAPPEARNIGMVFQDYALFPHMTLLENVEFGLTALKRSEARTEAQRILARVGLAHRANHYPDVLSGGEQQRVALARALAPRPGILLMDEPFSGLDSRLRDLIREQSIELLRETRSTAIIVTHDAEEALRVGDNIALIRDGRLVQFGSSHELYYNPVDLFTAGFFSEINTIPATVSQGVAVTIFGSCKTSLPDTPRVVAAVRHSDISVWKYVEDERFVPGKVLARRFLGTAELLDISLEGLEMPIQARIKTNELPRDVDFVSVGLDPELMMIFAE